MNVFSDIYTSNRWNGTASLSGPGSGVAPTRQAAEWLLELVEELEVETVLNVGCGDDLWTPDLPGYLGIDVAPEAIARARLLHPTRTYAVADARVGVPGGRWGLVIVRDVLQHLSFGDGLLLLSSIADADADWMVASTYHGASTRHPDPVNVDIETGGCYCNDLTLPPFDLEAPLERLRDGWDYEDGTRLRDTAKWLGLWRLR